MTKKTYHLHRYKKKNIGAEKDYFVYFCLKQGCTHYIPLEMAEGRECECDRCGKAMRIDRIVLTNSSGRPMTRPHCIDCIKRKKAKDATKIAEFLAGTTMALPVDETS